MNEQLVTSDQPAEMSSWPVLTGLEARVLGCLIEKAVTTPDVYPLTLNALTNACNQKSNRDPVMSVSDTDVAAALDSLRHTHRLAGLVHTAGSRTEKFRHTISNVIALNPEQAAILCELLLRGPETVGELRTRATRLCPLRDLDHVQQLLDHLAQHAGGPLVVKLPRESGRRESRWMHVLSGPVETAPDEPDDEQVEDDTLRQEITALRNELDQLKAEFALFRKQFE